MLRVSKKREVLYPVTVRQLKGDGSGDVIDAEIKIRYRLLTKTEIQERVREDLARGQNSREVLLNGYDAKRIKEYWQFVTDHVTGWEGVVDDETGEDIPFSRDAFKALLDSSVAFSEAVDTGLWQASREVPPKN